MEEKADLAAQIQTICDHANLSVREENPNNPAYQQYLRAFEALLRAQISRLDDEKTEDIQSMIRVIYIVYSDLLESSEQESTQSAKLAEYIKKVLADIPTDTSYLEHWSMLSCIDALSQENQLEFENSVDTSETLEQYVERSSQELDELLTVEEQKLSIAHEDDLVSDDDDDLLSKEMENILHVAMDIHAEQNQFELEYQKLAASKEVAPLSLDIRVASNDTTQGDHDAETASFTTHPDDSSAGKSSPPSLSNSRNQSPARIASEHNQDQDKAMDFLVAFSDKFSQLVSNFQGKSLVKKMQPKEKVILETITDQVVRTLLDAYKHCFQEGVTEESLTAFSQLSDSIIKNWSYWNKQDLSKSNLSMIDQDFTKLKTNLLELIETTRQNLPEASQQRAFKDR